MLTLELSGSDDTLSNAYGLCPEFVIEDGLLFENDMSFREL